MIKKELIAPCGMNCAICIGYFGYTMSGDKRKIKCKGCIPSGKSCAFIKKLMKDELKFYMFLYQKYLVLFDQQLMLLESQQNHVHHYPS